MQNPHHFLHVGPHLTCDTRLPCRYTRKNSPSTPSPPLTREKTRPAQGILGPTRYETRPARTPHRLNRYKTRPAHHKTPIFGHFSRARRIFSRSGRQQAEQGELFHAQADNKPSRANFFTHRTQPRGNCETAITTATADADQHETTITTATEKLTQNTHFSPAKAMAVSVGAKPARAKATPVSRERFMMPAGYGGAWPGFETTRRATHQRPGTTGVEGAGGSGGPGRGAGGWRQGQGGPRDRPLRAQLACGDLAGGRARRRPEHQRSRKQQAQSQITAAPPV